MTETPPSSAPQTPPQPPAANGKPVPDRELLRRFVRLDDRAAFAALVRRHSGLVIGVCRRVLRSEHDIEDAFQATFLVLARDAGRIRKSDSLASWLHGVAYRTSLRAADSTRRRGRLLRELTMIDDTLTPADDSGPLAKVEQRHQQQALDEELASLPDNYRAALVLHYLDGKSNQQVADELNLSVTAVEGRLKRGKKELRLRLARRGIGLSVAVAAMQAVQSSASAAAPMEPLIARAIDAGLSYAGGEAAGPVYSPEAARLAGQELMTMSATKTATLAAVVLLPLVLGFAGHAPAPAVSSSSGAVNTVLAQSDVEADVEADEKASPDSGVTSPNVDAIEFGASAIDPALGGEFGFASGGDAGDEQPAGSVSDVRVTTVHKDEDGRIGVVVHFRRDGALYRKVVWLDDDEVETRQIGAGETDAVTKADDPPMPDDPAEPARPLSPASEVIDYARIPPSDMRIQHELEKESQIEFVDTPLSDAMDFISSQHEIPILIDETALTDVGIPIDEPINLILHDVTLQTVFNHILRPLGLTTIIRDEVLQVTTKDVADEYLVTRVYDIRDLAGLEQEQLLQVLQESLPDAEWKEGVVSDEGGTASILGDALVVKQSQSAHRQIVDLLGQLRRHMEQHPQSQPFEDASSTHRSKPQPDDSLLSPLEAPSDTSDAPPTTERALHGLVIATRTGKSGEVEFVEITLGSDDGLRSGDKVGVYRQMTRPSPYDGANVVAMAPVGQLEIVFVTSNRAVGRVTSAKNSELTIERGDQVVWDRVDQGKAIPGDAAKAAPAGGELKGLVTATRADESGDIEFVEVSIGSDDGLREDDELDIFSSTGMYGEYLARVRVDEVWPQKARAHLIGKEDGVEIKVGDNAWRPLAAEPATEGPGKQPSPQPQYRPSKSHAADSSLFEAAEVVSRERVLKLRIDRDGQTWYAGREVSLDQIEGFKQKERPATVELDVDPNAPYKAVSDLIETLKSGDTTPQIRFASPTRESADAFPVPEPIPDESAEAGPWNAPEPMENPQQELVLSLDAEGQVLHGSQRLKPGELPKLIGKRRPTTVELLILVGTSSRDVSRVIESIREAGGGEEVKFTIRTFEEFER